MALLCNAFTPRQPKRWRDHFVGRVPQIERALAAIADERAHVVLFGDRGRGKTSLANVVAERLVDRSYAVVRCTSSAEVTFEAIVRQLFQRLPADRLDCRLQPGERPDKLLPEGPFAVADLCDAARHVARGQVLMVVDEFDRIGEPAVRGRFADAIKGLSDARSRMSLLLVGVAGNLEGLLGAHPSIERNVVGIHVPLLAAPDVEALVASGAEAAGLAFEPAVVDGIVRISQGLPYCAQLLSLYSARHALRRGSRAVAMADFRHAGGIVLEEMRSGVGAVHERVTATSAAVTGLLAMIAAAPCDEYGVVGEAALASLADADRAWVASVEGRHVLRAVKGGVAFSDALMRQFILLESFAARGGFGEGAPPATPKAVS